MTQSSLISGATLNSQDSLLPEILRTVLRAGNDCRFQVKGHSMSPFIKDGDVVTISPMSDSSPGFGDVVAFIYLRTEKLVIHRVVRKSRDACIIKGENTLESDGLIKKENILGVVTKIERKGKKVFCGIGPERFLIALLSRKNLLLPILLPVWRILRPAARIFLP
jgi:signal peptidase I